jgi:hypothetical protein
MALVFLAAIVFNILLYTDFFGNNMQLHVDLPGKVDFLETGNLHLNDQDFKVELVDSSARIHFINTPAVIARKAGLMILIVIGLGSYLTWIFRLFIKNVKEGNTFTLKNIALLKRIAYGLTGFWVITIIYMRITYYYISGRLEFEHVQITDDFSNYPWLLFSALITWMLAHAFMTGVRLQEEQDLTI